MSKLVTIVLGILFVLAITLAFTMLGWYLFVVPVFNLPPLTFMQALGFSILVNGFKTNVQMRS